MAWNREINMDVPVGSGGDKVKGWFHPAVIVVDPDNTIVVLAHGYGDDGDGRWGFSVRGCTTTDGEPSVETCLKGNNGVPDIEIDAYAHHFDVKILEKEVRERVRVKEDGSEFVRFAITLKEP